MKGTQILLQELSGTSATIKCPKGWKLRIVGVLCATQGGGTGEGVSLAFRHSGLNVFLSTSILEDATIAKLQFAIGHAPIPNWPESFTPATGVYNWSGNQDQAQASLPDAWLPFDVDLLITSTLGTVSLVRAVYELAPYGED